MALSDLFAYLGAALKNTRWSWGAVRTCDGSVFLRVWQDECGTVNSIRVVRITDNKYFANTPDSHGYIERLQHIDLIRSGSPSFLIMCLAQNVGANPRVIHSFNDREIFVGGRLIDHDGDVWLEMVRRVPVADVRP